MGTEELHNLASSYNLRVQVLPSVVLVYSKINQMSQWLVEKNHKGIALYHFNNPRKNCKTHSQIEFLNEVSTYEYVFKFINGHDSAILTGTKHMKKLK